MTTLTAYMPPRLLASFGDGALAEKAECGCGDRG